MSDTGMTYAITTLGCKVNEYESAFYEEQMESIGLRPAKEGEAADVVLINTCTVTNTAAAKSRQKINRARKENPNAFCVVTGCYVQTLEEDLRKQLNADLLIGASHKNELGKRIAQGLESHEKADLVTPISDLTSFESMPIGSFEHQHRAFLKIQDGCNQYCAFCQIPLARGPERSLTDWEVVETAKKLADAGHKEIVLTGIHTGRYSFRNVDLAALLEKLLENTPEDVCYRISSIEITEVDDRLLSLMEKNPRVLPHLHIPIQAACDATLARMKRPYTVEMFEKKMDEIRKKIPQVSVSTDVICGFVQESDEEFETTKANLEKIGFSFLHVFPYSRRKGTAADAMTGFVDGNTAKARTHELLELSKELRHKDMERFKEGKVLIERPVPGQPGWYSGYTEQYHPAKVHSDHDLSGRVSVIMDDIKEGSYICSVKETK